MEASKKTFYKALMDPSLKPLLKVNYNTKIVIVLLVVVIATIISYGQTASTNGNISINVKYKGTPPNISSLKVTRDQEACTHEVPNETLIIDSLNNIKNVMLYLKDAKGKIGVQDYILNNKGCRFVPHVGFATVGGKLKMTNDDDIMHNTHGFYVVDDMKRTIVNTALPNKGSEIVNARVFNNPGLIEVECDAHEWMSATIIVIDHPYYGITGTNGDAKIMNVPAGQYELIVYHETLGEQVKKVSVVAGETTNLKIEMSKKIETSE